MTDNLRTIMVSINKPHSENIKKGFKTIEVRKSKPKGVFKAFIYETKKTGGCGKVIGEFICNASYPIKVFENGSIQYWEFLHLCRTCLSYDELAHYIGNGKTGFGWVISYLKIYDKPKELNEFYTWKKCNSCHISGYESTACRYDIDCKVPVPLERPPQSWMYVNEF